LEFRKLCIVGNDTRGSFCYLSFIAAEAGEHNIEHGVQGEGKEGVAAGVGVLEIGDDGDARIEGCVADERDKV
jgi:hypothetical protein